MSFFDFDIFVMAADFPVGKVFVASSHDTKDRDVQFCPFKFESLSEGCHGK